MAMLTKPFSTLSAWMIKGIMIQKASFRPLKLRKKKKSTRFTRPFKVRKKKKQAISTISSSQDVSTKRANTEFPHHKTLRVAMTKTI